MSKIHAIDGGMFDHALCEEVTGDSTKRERDVTCSDCLDLLDELAWEDYTRMSQMEKAGWEACCPTRRP